MIGYGVAIGSGASVFVGRICSIFFVPIIMGSSVIVLIYVGGKIYRNIINEMRCE